MLGFEIAAISVLAMIILIYLGMHVAIALALVSFIGVWFIRGSASIATSLLWSAAERTVDSYTFAVVPLFVLMGLMAGRAGLGKDAYELAHRVLCGIAGGLGMATVVANAIFAAITGVSIASASVFAKLSVPEMLRHGYQPRFAVGVVAGSSVLGMLIPPSVLLIVFAIIAEQSIGDLFVAGIVPGVLLTLAFCLLIWITAHLRPSRVFADRSIAEGHAGPMHHAPATRYFPIAILIFGVLGGMYGGLFTPTEAAAVGALLATIIAFLRRTLDARSIWALLKETGSVTATILFLVVGATMYSRMLGVSGLPTQIGTLITEMDASFWFLISIYVLILILLGTIIDSISIMLITVPLFMEVLSPYGIDLVWFGIITVIAVEIGLITPPFGIAVYVVHSTLGRSDVSIGDVFRGAFPFALMMFLVLWLIIFVPGIATFLVDLR